MVANVVRWRDVKLHRCFVFFEESTLYVLHFGPRGSSIDERHRNVIPTVPV